MDPTTGNHSYYTPCTHHKPDRTGMDWTGMDYGRLVVLKRSLCNNAIGGR